MIWIDWLFILAIGISAISSFMRGALREIVSLGAWLLGVYVAFMYSANSQALLEPYIETPEFRYAIVFMTILIIFLILGAVLGILLNRVITAIGLSSLDKSLGIIFGVARGVLLVVIFIMVASFTALTQNTWWQSSLIIKKLEPPAEKLLAWLEESSFWPENAPKPGQMPALPNITPPAVQPTEVGPPATSAPVTTPPEAGSLVPVTPTN
jgi:membrane protein required for colicin V production